MTQILLHPNQPFMLLPDTVDVNRVLAHVTGSRVVERENRLALLAPHNSHTVYAARGIGLEVPSSISTRYNWPGRFKPMAHQLRTAEFMTLNPRCCILDEMGTGKTASALWAADHLMREGLIRHVLVISPLSTVDSVWGEEIFRFVPHRSYRVLHGTRDQRLHMSRTESPDFFILNHDGYRVTGLLEALAKRDIGLVIYDEASALKDGTTARYKSLTRFLKTHPTRLWLMTGTPTPNAPSDAWALARLINPYDSERNPQGCPSSFVQFRDRVMLKQGPFRWVPRPNARVVVRTVLQPAIRHKKSECIDLPDLLFSHRIAAATPDQLRGYAEMKKHMVTSALDEDGNRRIISAINAAAQLGKILQLFSGAAYRENGEVVHFDVSPKLEAMKEIVEQASKKTVVFVPYRHVIKRVLDFLVEAGITCDVMDGQVVGQARDLLLRRFTRNDDPRVLIANPKTASHGLNLTVANTIIWFGPIMSPETYLQGVERINRPGQDTKMLVVNLSCHQVEQKYFQLLTDRKNLQAGILNLYEEIIA